MNILNCSARRRSARAGLVHEGVVLGVVERHPQGALGRARAQAGDVVLGQAVEVLTGEVEPVLVLVDVAGEGHPQFHEAGAQALHLGALFRSEAVPGAAQVPPGELEEAGLFSRCRRRLRGGGVGLHRLVEVAAEGQVGDPLAQPLLGGLSGVAHLLVRVHPGHEGAAPRGDGDRGSDAVERGHGRFPGARRLGGDDGGEQFLGASDGAFDFGAHRSGGGGGVVVEHGRGG